MADECREKHDLPVKKSTPHKQKELDGYQFSFYKNQDIYSEWVILADVVSYEIFYSRYFEGSGDSLMLCCPFTSLKL